MLPLGVYLKLDGLKMLSVIGRVFPLRGIVEAGCFLELGLLGVSGEVFLICALHQRLCFDLLSWLHPRRNHVYLCIDLLLFDQQLLLGELAEYLVKREVFLLILQLRRDVNFLHILEEQGQELIAKIDHLTLSIARFAPQFVLLQEPLHQLVVGFDIFAWFVHCYLGCFLALISGYKDSKWRYLAESLLLILDGGQRSQLKDILEHGGREEHILAVELLELDHFIDDQLGLEYQMILYLKNVELGDLLELGDCEALSEFHMHLNAKLVVSNIFGFQDLLVFLKMLLELVSVHEVCVHKEISVSGHELPQRLLKLAVVGWRDHDLVERLEGDWARERHVLRRQALAQGLQDVMHRPENLEVQKDERELLNIPPEGPGRYVSYF